MTIYREFWESLEARDWDRFAATVADEVIAEWPMSGERVRGREALVRFMAEFPGDWHLELVEEHADDGGAATRIEFRLAADRMVGLTFFTVGPSGISSLREFWPERYEPPPGRAHLVDRFDPSYT
jgi:hypothetical protein